MNEELKSALFRVLPLLIGLILIIYFVKKGRVDKSILKLNKPNKGKFLIWIIAFACYVIGVELILFYTGNLEIKPWHHPDIPATIIRITGMLILAPVVEEILFRGIILHKLTQKFNFKIALIIQAFIFMLLHYTQIGFSFTGIVGIVQIVIDATLFAMAMRSTNSIYTNIAMHILGNSMAVLEMLIVNQ